MTGFQSTGAAVLLLLLVPGSGVAAPLCREVGSAWQWFGDHVVLTIDYVIVGAHGRRYEVGTGPSVNGSPWGWRESYVGSAEVAAWGAGAIHIRQKDDGPLSRYASTQLECHQ